MRSRRRSGSHIVDRRRATREECALYEQQAPSAAAGSAVHQTDILSGTSIDPRMASAVDKLSATLLGRPGIVAIADNAVRGGIDIFALAAYAAMIRSYVDNVLMGTFMGFPIDVRVSSPLVAQGI